VPRRLIEISDGIRLVDFGQHGSHHKLAKYATLSHSWGSKEAASSLAKTLSTNIQQHMVAIRRDELPQVFRDAIDVARALNCDFVWIDSLCIIQDSPEDWQEQSTLMSDVYSNAYFNIAASALPDSSGTLFQDRVHVNALSIDTLMQWVPNDEAIQCPVTVRYSMDRAHRHICGEAQYAHESEEPLLDRAWVFQERMLSRRTVYISSSEVLWECRSGYLCECGNINNPIPTGTDRWSWENMMQEYTMLLLTRESDRDIALSGIRQSFMTGRDFTFYAGMWIQDLPQSLLWIVGGAVSPPIAYEKGLDAPSWSW
ncbi:heterokaryon incompatibility protein-domain-containing protein, partial [Sordaria brevicollis]